MSEKRKQILEEKSFNKLLVMKYDKDMPYDEVYATALNLKALHKDKQVVAVPKTVDIITDREGCLFLKEYRDRINEILEDWE